MIVYFRICNFKSIVDTSIDMRYGEGKAPNGYKDMEHLPFLECPIHKGNSLRLSPVMAIYGQNAGGKTSLIEAMQVLRHCVCEGKLSYMPNKLHPELAETTFEISYMCDGLLFTYSLHYNHSGVRRELLRNHLRLIFEIDHDNGIYRFDHLVTAQYTHDYMRAVLAAECSNTRNEQITTFFGKLAFHYPGLNAELSNAFDFLADEVTISRGNRFAAPFAINYLAESMRDISYMKSFEEIASFLRRLDIDIVNMELVAGDEEEDYRINSYHRASNGELVLLDFQDESRGTQVLFGLLGVLLRKLRTGGVLVIDEIDCSLHTHLLVALVALFVSKEYNAKGAQLILTAHNTELLESPYLRTSQIAIVTKTAQGGTIARRLCDFEGMRNIRNFRKTYLEGSFSGIPFPII